MFKKKKKNKVEEVEAEVVDMTDKPEPVKATKIDPEPTDKRDNPASFFDFSEDDPIESDEVVEDIEEPKKEKRSKKKENKKESKRKTRKQKKQEKEHLESNDEVISVVIGEEPWKWSNNEEYETKLEEANKKLQENQIDLSEDSKPKKELSAYFEENKDKNQKLKRKDKKALKKAEKENNDSKDKKGKKHSKSKKEQLQEDIKNQKVFRYNGKKYTKVEDFITYLNEHYLDIEEISEEILEDENFFGWINKSSGVFAKSLKEFKEIKEKIEKKS